MVFYITASAESENETEREMEAGSTAVVVGPHAGARTGLAMPLQRSLYYMQISYFNCGHAALQ